VKKYRPNVAFILRRESGEVLWCEREDWRESWQFPQGGVDKNETPESAVVREVKEEIALYPKSYRMVEQRGPYTYDFPPDNKRFKQYAGQKQTYFLADLTDSKWKPKFGSDPEFVRAIWIMPEEISIASVPQMKQDVYRAVLRDFFHVNAT